VIDYFSIHKALLNVANEMKTIGINLIKPLILMGYDQDDIDLSVSDRLIMICKKHHA
jgi:hypothetical protein